MRIPEIQRSTQEATTIPSTRPAPRQASPYASVIPNLPPPLVRRVVPLLARNLHRCQYSPNSDLQLFTDVRGRLISKFAPKTCAGIMRSRAGLKRGGTFMRSSPQDLMATDGSREAELAATTAATSLGAPARRYTALRRGAAILSRWGGAGGGRPGTRGSTRTQAPVERQAARCSTRARKGGGRPAGRWRKITQQGKADHEIVTWRKDRGGLIYGQQRSGGDRRA